VGSRHAGAAVGDSPTVRLDSAGLDPADKEVGQEMAESPVDPKPTPRTPAGYEILVPKRGEFDANLDKLLKAPQPPTKVAGRRPGWGNAAPYTT
jgi:hypothetical protein